MAMREFTLENVRELDGGRVAAAFDLAIRQVLADCDDRPGEAKSRKVVLTAEIVPVMDDVGLCDGVRTKIHVKAVIPDRKSKDYSMGLRKTQRGHQMVFNDGDPDNHRQKTIDDATA